MQIRSNVSDNKQALLKMSFYQQSTILLYSFFYQPCSAVYFLMTFNASVFLNIELEPTMALSPRRRSRGLHNPDSPRDQIRWFWLAEFPNFANIMME